MPAVWLAGYTFLSKGKIYFLSTFLSLPIVQYNESEPGMPADWKQLIDVNKQDGSDPYLALVEPNMVHLLVDHFTAFAVTGESAPNEYAKKTVQIVAYVTPPEADADCVVRVYCVGDTPVHLEVCSVVQSLASFILALISIYKETLLLGLYKYWHLIT